jgi:carboxylesterase type B
VSPKMRGLTTARVLRPIHDGWIVPEDERAALKAGHLRLLPTLLGTNADEGSLLTRGWTVNTLRAYRDLVEANFGDAAEQAMMLYPASTDAQAVLRTAEIFADTQFNYGARLLAQTISRCEPRTWVYLFTRRRPDQRDGPHHGDEVGYVFGNLGADRAGMSAYFDSTDTRVSRAMMGAWLAFARTGDPNATDLAAWPPYTANTESILEFGDDVRAGHVRRVEQLDFLDSFYDRV